VARQGRKQALEGPVDMAPLDIPLHAGRDELAQVSVSVEAEQRRLGSWLPVIVGLGIREIF